MLGWTKDKFTMASYVGFKKRMIINAWLYVNVHIKYIMISIVLSHELFISLHARNALLEYPYLFIFALLLIITLLLLFLIRLQLFRIIIVV